jgi:hypothetical protein
MPFWEFMMPLLLNIWYKQRGKNELSPTKG